MCLFGPKHACVLILCHPWQHKNDKLLPPLPVPVAPAALELGAQIKLVATSGTIACFLDVFSICLNLLLLWKMTCDPYDDVCMSISKYAFVFTLCCAYHASISYMVSKRAASIMPLLNPVSSGAVQL